MKCTFCSIPFINEDDIIINSKFQYHCGSCNYNLSEVISRSDLIRELFEINKIQCSTNLDIVIKNKSINLVDWYTNESLDEIHNISKYFLATELNKILYNQHLRGDSIFLNKKKLEILNNI